MRRAGLRFTAVAAAAVVLGEAAPAADLPDALDRNRDGRIVVACLGDSNTDSAWQHQKEGGFPAGRGWCEILGEDLDGDRVRVVNLGIGGATIGPHWIGGGPEGRAIFEGSHHLDVALAEQPVDAVVLAFGTNDILPESGSDPSQIVDDYNRVWRRARANDVLALVATTPPVLRHARSGEHRRSLAAIEMTNEGLRETFAPRHVVDFHVGVAPDDFLDDLHLGASGMEKRAEAARRALLALAESAPMPAGVRAVRWSRGHFGPKLPHADAERDGD
jgi:lysophospholipase L1-like esterase